jgi:hypothetical protein
MTTMPHRNQGTLNYSLFDEPTMIFKLGSRYVPG